MFALLALLAVLATASVTSALGRNPAVTSLSVPEYLGLWYEMYGDKFVLDTFQKGAFCATALYGDNGDGTVSVYNYQTDNSPSGNVSDITGYAYYTDPSKQGELKVHLDGVPTDADYWVLALGPLYNGLYDWAVVSDNISLSLFILARDYNRFNTLYKDDVLALTKSLGFTAIPIYQGDDCVYSSTIRAKHIKMALAMEEAAKSK